MRVAILSESSADESALRILVDAVLGIKTTIPEMVPLQTRGWHAVRNTLSAIANNLHYRTDADGLVVVVDSNHTYLSKADPKNRLHEFQGLAQRCRESFRPLPGGRIPLKIAVGVAAPAIEAWWLCQSHPHISELAWEKGLEAKRDPYSKQELKRQLYGSEFYPLEVMTRKMTEAAHAISSDLTSLERAFPHGFGSLAKELRRWRQVGGI